jgi:hypothetical protein
LGNSATAIGAQTEARAPVILNNFATARHGRKRYAWLDHPGTQMAVTVIGRSGRLEFSPR